MNPSHAGTDVPPDCGDHDDVECVSLELAPEYEALYHHWAVMLLGRGQADSGVAILDQHVKTPEWYDGWLYAAAGRREKGQGMLDSLLALNATRLGPHPAFDGVRRDPRFRELRKKAGLKQ